jgi:outer membrane protein OmpA-like peptidoglycan-associated protein
MALQFKNKLTKVHDVSSITLTPRWDHKWFGVFVPVQYNFLDGYRGGLALRLGPLVLGTSNIAPLVSNQKIYGADFYTLLKIPIPYGKPKDKDHDGVSDKKDLCKTIPGLWQFNGCPDTDGDGIKDSDDKCPELPGVKELNGCPDADGDSITDLEDNCPHEKGLAKFRGCPDRDGDDIIDKLDSCPDVKGFPIFFGCPDTDGDSIPDKEDNCPDVAGPKVYKGCPDKDGDTVLDKDDACPDSAGVVENKGCPWPDTDKDSVIDKEDECPLIAGLVELKGCLPAPVLKVEEQKILEKAFASLEFATGKDIIKKTSLPSLTELAGLMKQHADDWTLKLSGHTDNQGDSLKNTLLSEKRAKAVKKFLVSNGVATDKITTEWFGPTKPIEDNGTELGRQKNRRVEMKVDYKK